MVPALKMDLQKELGKKRLFWRGKVAGPCNPSFTEILPPVGVSALFLKVLVAFQLGHSCPLYLHAGDMLSFFLGTAPLLSRYQVSLVLMDHLLQSLPDKRYLTDLDCLETSLLSIYTRS